VSETVIRIVCVCVRVPDRVADLELPTVDGSRSLVFPTGENVDSFPVCFRKYPGRCSAIFVVIRFGKHDRDLAFLPEILDHLFPRLFVVHLAGGREQPRTRERRLHQQCSAHPLRHGWGLEQHAFPRLESLGFGRCGARLGGPCPAVLRSSLRIRVRKDVGEAFVVLGRITSLEGVEGQSGVVARPLSWGLAGA
jgi:hypothetical protein